MRTPEEIEEMMRRIVKFKNEKQPWDLETIVICIKHVKGYKDRAEQILKSLKEHRESIPAEIIGGVKIPVITSRVAEEGRRIHNQMQTLIKDFLRGECERT